MSTAILIIQGLFDIAVIIYIINDWKKERE